jgi:hypothetical protein
VDIVEALLSNVLMANTNILQHADHVQQVNIVLIVVILELHVLLVVQVDILLLVQDIVLHVHLVKHHVVVLVLVIQEL